MSASALIVAACHVCVHVSAVTAEKIKAVVIAASRAENETHDSHMTSDEDEGMSGLCACCGALC